MLDPCGLTSLFLFGVFYCGLINMAIVLYAQAG